MPARSEFLYTILRIVPSLERGERLNAGVAVFCRQLEYLGARAMVDPVRLRALGPDLDPLEVEAHLRSLCAIAEGDASAGPLAAMSRSDRFGWLTSPTSTAVQPSPVHTGLTHDPAATLDRLYTKLVEVRPADPTDQERRRLSG